VRTATPADFTSEPRADLLQACRALDASVLTAEETAAGSMTAVRHLAVLDALSSTSTLGFRIDAAKTVVNGELAQLPLPDGKTFSTLRDEPHVSAALATFVQRDARLLKAAVLKLEAIAAACERSTFFSRQAFLRSALLFVYDDASREKEVS
jgi:hypothetical protein